MFKTPGVLGKSLAQIKTRTLRWIRTFGDVVFIVGAIAMALQVVLGLMGKAPKAAVRQPQAVRPG